MIVARAAQGVPWEEIAREAGISIRSCQRAVETRKQMPTDLERAPMELVEEFTRDFRASIADYEAMAFAYSATNPTAALGAKKAADESRSRLINLLDNIGKLPDNFELFRSEVEMMLIAERMAEELRLLRDGHRSPQEVLDFFRSLVTRRQRRALPEAV